MSCSCCYKYRGPAVHHRLLKNIVCLLVCDTCKLLLACALAPMPFRYHSIAILTGAEPRSLQWGL